jgi:hypothetical protein
MGKVMNAKDHEEMFRDNENFLYLDCGVSFTDL